MQGKLVVMECYSIDEKMGQTYVHKECANTLAQRDYKQPLKARDYKDPTVKIGGVLTWKQ